MFKKVLTVEDHQSISTSVRRTLEDLGVSHHDHRYYCEEAHALLKNAFQKDTPYDLLISDLSFEEDASTQGIKSGKELIAEAKKIDPYLKVIVFSIEDKADTVEELFDELEVDGYVLKGRYDVEDLKKAIDAVQNGKRYRSIALPHRKVSGRTYEFSALDLEIIALISKGEVLKNISGQLKKSGASGCSLSSIEKRLHKIREELHIANNSQLIAYCKDKKII